MNPFHARCCLFETYQSSILIPYSSVHQTVNPSNQSIKPIKSSNPSINQPIDQLIHLLANSSNQSIHRNYSPFTRARGFVARAFLQEKHRPKILASAITNNTTQQSTKPQKKKQTNKQSNTTIQTKQTKQTIQTIQTLQTIQTKQYKQYKQSNTNKHKQTNTNKQTQTNTNNTKQYKQYKQTNTKLTNKHK